MATRHSDIASLHPTKNARTGARETRSVGNHPLGKNPAPSNGRCDELIPLHSGAQTETSSDARQAAIQQDDASIDGVLDITLHHASNIHNICIYGKQDVYAKFSITQTQGASYSTQAVRGGGQNPVFNQGLQILVSRRDAVLKCELWMMSCSRSYLEDQLLGLALVPLDDIMGAGKITCDYPLTSTELFHAPAGMVRLSLRFYKRSLEPFLPDIIISDGRKPAAENGTSSCPVAHQEKGSSEAVDYSSIEFPDLQVASEDQELVSMYMDMVTTDPQTDEDPDNADGTQRRSMIEGAPRENYTDQKKVLKNAPLRQTHVISGASATELTMSDSQGECGMTSKTMKEKNVKRIGSSDHAPYRSNVAEDMELLPLTNVSHQLDLKGSVSNEQMTDIKESKLSASNKAGSPGMSTSASSGGGHSSSDEKSLGSADRHTSLPSNSSGPPPVVSISLDTEEPVVQQQIVDMYMKSMQQFTESLAKMKLPFDMDSTKSQEENRSNDLNGSQKETETSTASRSEPTTKDATHARRVFYGSRAFF